MPCCWPGAAWCPMCRSQTLPLGSVLPKRDPHVARALCKVLPPNCGTWHPGGPKEPASRSGGNPEWVGNRRRNSMKFLEILAIQQTWNEDVWECLGVFDNVVYCCAKGLASPNKKQKTTRINKGTWWHLNILKIIQTYKLNNQTSLNINNKSRGHISDQKEGIGEERLHAIWHWIFSPQNPRWQTMFPTGCHVGEQISVENGAEGRGQLTSAVLVRVASSCYCGPQRHEGHWGSTKWLVTVRQVKGGLQNGSSRFSIWKTTTTTSNIIEHHRTT